jgi:hypothetical protein
MAAERILVCMPLSMMPNPPVPARKRHCDLCGAPIWVARTSPRGVARHCMPCVRDLIGSATEVKVAPLSEAQVAEVRAYFKRQEH